MLTLLPEREGEIRTADKSRGREGSYVVEEPSTPETGQAGTGKPVTVWHENPFMKDNQRPPRWLPPGSQAQEEGRPRS